MIGQAPRDQSTTLFHGPETSLGRPWLPFVDHVPAGRLDLLDDARNRVERSRGCVDVRAQALGNREVDDGHGSNDGPCRHEVVEIPVRWLASTC